MERQETIIRCSICGEVIYGQGRTSVPVKEGLCCERCHSEVVRPRVNSFLNAVFASMEQGRPITSPETAYRYIKSHFKGLHHSGLWIIYLEENNIPITIEMIESGEYSHTSVDYRKIFTYGLQYDAKGMIMVSRHLTDSCEPSINEINCTGETNSTGKTLGISLLDHIIISTKGYFSFASETIKPIKDNLSFASAKMM